MPWSASPLARCARCWAIWRRRPASLPRCRGGGIAFWPRSRSTLAWGVSPGGALARRRPPAEPVPVAAPQLPETLPPLEAERRQLTVLFCDLVDSTTLAGHLDPEDLREVVRAYHQTCAAVIHRFDGRLAQYLGDGMLVYFGYPLAHEDAAQRAVRTGLGMPHALDPLHTRLTLPL